MRKVQTTRAVNDVTNESSTVELTIEWDREALRGVLEQYLQVRLGDGEKVDDYDFSAFFETPKSRIHFDNGCTLVTTLRKKE